MYSIDEDRSRREKGLFMKKLEQHAAVRSILGIIFLLVAFSTIVSIIGYNGFTDALLDQYADGAFRTARTAALALDADRIDEYAASGGVTEEYRDILAEMDALCNSSGATFIYVIRPDRTDYGHITFLFSTKNQDSPYELYDFGYVRETTNDEYRRKYRAIYEKESDRELLVRDKGFIETDPHVTAMIGLEGEDGEVKALLCVQRQTDVLSRARHIFLRKVLAALIILVMLVIAGQSLFLNRVLLRPLRLISEEANRFAAEHITTGEKLREKIQSNDEIARLAGSIDQMEEQIRQYIENLTRATAEKERISTELGLATRIQASMLPDVFPPFPDRTEFDIYAVMDPAREVGGDFYDFYFIDDDHLCLTIADVSGKGIPAALFMMASKIILANNAMSGKTPAQILSDTNAAICPNNQEEMFVTVWLGILEISTGKLTAANAGHEYPVLRRGGEDFALFRDKHGLVIGGMDGVRYKEYELRLQPGDKLFVYSDGVPEATDADNNMFGTDRMLAALNGDPGADPGQLLQDVRRAVDGFVKDAEQFDDLTMLCVEYKGR